MRISPVSSGGSTYGIWVCPACSGTMNKLYSFMSHIGVGHPALVYIQDKEDLLISGPELLDLETANPNPALILHRTHSSSFFCPKCRHNLTNAQAMDYHLTVTHSTTQFTLDLKRDVFLIYPTSKGEILPCT